MWQAKTAVKGLAWTALVAVAFGVVSCVPASNPYDPEAPREGQQPAKLRGMIAADTLDDLSGLALDLHVEGGDTVVVETTADGSFVSGDLLPGRVTVELNLDGFIPLRVTETLDAGEDRDLGVLQLVPVDGADTAVLVGTASLEGEDEHGGILVEAVGRSFTTFTDSTGGFRLNVLPGTYNLRFTRANYATLDVENVEVGTGEEKTLDPVVLANNPATISGHVDGERTDGSIGPMADATVTVDGTALTAITNDAGDFTLTGVAPGSHAIRALKDDYVGASTNVFNLVGGEVRVLPAPLTLALSRGALTGTVQLADTADASGIIVELTGRNRTEVTGSSGRFAFEGLVAGTYEVVARRDGYALRVLGTFTVAAESELDVGSFTLARAGGLVAIVEAPATSSTDIGLLLSAANATGFRASQDETFTDATLGDTTADDFRPFTPGQPVPFSLQGGDGEKRIFVVFTDGDTESAPASATVVLDRRPPEGVVVTIEGGAAFTNASQGIVSVQVSAFDLPPPATPTETVAGLSKLHLSSDALFTDPQVLDFNSQVTFTLPDAGTDGDKQVFARVVDAAQNASDVVSATIVLDRAAPDSASLVVSGDGAASADMTRSPLVVLTLDANDANEGQDKANLLVRVSNAPGFPGAVYQPFAAQLSHFLAPPDGGKTVYAQFRDGAGNESLVVSDDIELDTAAPGTPSIVLQENDSRPNNGATNDRDVVVEFTAAGNPVRALLSESPAFTNAIELDTDGVAQPVSSSFTFSADGERTLWVRAFDAAGNMSDPAFAEVVVDESAPAAVAPELVSGATVQSQTVQVRIPAAEQTEVEFGGDVTSPTGFVSVTPGAVVDVTLSPGEGSKSVSVTWRDAADNTTAVGPLAVLVDQSAPTATPIVIQGVPNTSVTRTPNVTLQLAATDALSAVDQMKVSSRADLADAVYMPFVDTLAFSLPGADGTKTVYAQFVDEAGNESSVVQGSIDLLSTPPTGAVLIAGGADTTQDATVALSLSAVGATEMAISDDAFAGGTTWVPFATTAMHTFSGPDEATKVVSVKFRNAAELEGAVASDSIYFDQTPPGAGTLALVGSLGNGTSSSTRSASPAVIAQVTANDDDVTHMALAQAAGVNCAASDFASPAFQPFSGSSTFVIAGVDGDKRVCVLLRDRAGNSEATAFAGASLSLDTQPPTSPTFVNLSSSTTSDADVAATLTASVDNISSPVLLQCKGAQYGNDFVDCGTTPSFTFSLNPNQENVLAVRARDEAYNVSDAAVVAIVHDDIAPLPPAIDGVEADANKLAVAWTPSPSDDVVEYIVNYGNLPGDDGGQGSDQGDSPIAVGLTTSAQLTGLNTNTPYYISVQAVDAAGNVGDASGEVIGVPAKTDLRVISSFGGEIRQTTALGANGYLLQRQSVAQVDLDATPDLALTGRAALPNFVPDTESPVATARCAVDGDDGDCLYVVGVSAEGIFRNNPRDYRAGVTVVFFPDGGTADTPVAGRVLTTLSVRARMLVVDEGQDVLYTVDLDNGVRAYDIDVPTIPVLLGEVAHVTPMNEIKGAGLLNDELFVVGSDQIDDGIGDFLQNVFGYDTVALTSGTPTPGVDYGQPLRQGGNPYGTSDYPPPTVAIGAGFDLLDGATACRYDLSGANFPDPEGCVTAPDLDSVFGRQPIAVTKERIFVFPQFFSPAGANQVVTIETAGANLALGPTGTAFNGGDMLSILNGAVGGSSGRRLLLVEERRQLSLPLRDLDQTVARFDAPVGAGTVTSVGNAFLDPGGEVFGVVDDLVIVAREQSLHVVDVSNPSVPRVVDRYEDARTTGWYARVKTQGNLVFAMWRDNTGIDIFDVDVDGSITFLARATERLFPSNAPVPQEYTDFTLVGSLMVAVREGSNVLVRYSLQNPSLANTYTFSSCTVSSLADIAALDARHGDMLLSSVDGDLLRYNPSTCANIGGVASPPASVTFDNGFAGGVRYVEWAGRSAAVSSEHVTYMANVFSSPSWDATSYAVGGPVALSGGYLMGPGPVVQAGSGTEDHQDGPRLLPIEGTGNHGSLSFVGCGPTDGDLLTSFAERDGVLYAACGRDGIKLSTGVRPGGGRLLREVGGTWAMTTRGLAVDGNSVYVSGRQASTASFPYITSDTLWHVDEVNLAKYGSLTGTDPLLNQTLGASTMVFDQGSLVAIAGFGASTRARLFDITRPTLTWPEIADVAGGTGAATSVTDGRYAFAAHRDSLQVYDIRSRATLSVATDYDFDNTFAQSRGLDLYRGQVYVSGDANEINVFAVTPSTGALSAQTPITAQTFAPDDLTVHGGFAFLTAGDVLEVVKLGPSGDGAGAMHIGSITLDGAVSDPTIVGDLLLLRQDMGLVAYDLNPLLADDDFPTFVGSVATADAPYDTSAKLTVAGPWAFLKGRSYRVFDLR